MIKFWNERDSDMVSMCVKCGRGVIVTVTKGFKTKLEHLTTMRRLVDHKCGPGDKQYFEKHRIQIKAREVIKEAALWHYAQPPGAHYRVNAQGYAGHYNLNYANTRPLEIRCPECSQPAGERCRNRGIRSRVVLNSTPHDSRIFTWLKARGLRLDNGYIVPKFYVPSKRKK